LDNLAKIKVFKKIRTLDRFDTFNGKLPNSKISCDTAPLNDVATEEEK
jgi:hypothetical protein